MGGGTYCYSARTERATDLGYFTKSSSEIFTQRNINNAMSPFGVSLRESRDSAEHPNSLAIVIGLDTTGSMGSIPNFLVKNGLPIIVSNIIQKGIADPQILFMGIGDHECDTAPLQVGQFESSDELLDKWLTTVYLEGGGGGNSGESYLLAWYFAGNHTSIDCLEKRGQKGFLFTIGDEPTLQHIPSSTLRKLMGEGQYSNVSAQELLDKARETFNVFHVHMTNTSSGERQHVQDGWKQLMQDSLILANRSEDVANLIADKIIEIQKNQVSSVIPNIITSDDTVDSTPVDEMIL